MGKCAIIRFAACATIAFMSQVVLPLSAAELAHRWSFNGDYSDSVGGVDAVKCGTYVSLYGGRVHMGYGACSHGTGYVDLGTNMLDTTAATIEIWARHDGVESWSRVFDYGADSANNVFLSWTFGTTLSKNQVGSKVKGAESKIDYQEPYEIGRDYHIAATFEKQGDGVTLVKWQRRDAATGELLTSGSLTMKGGIEKFVDPVLYLGHSQYESDKDALAAYDEVRLWRGVLTDAQLAASAAAGPDAAITADAEGLRFTAPAEPEPPAQRAAVPNGGFRLMTYNIRYCYDEVSTIVPERTAARIIAENPDFCCVNEVRDSESHPEATLLAKLTGMHKTFGGNDSRSNGNLILSKERPISSETVFLKMAPSPVGWGDRYCVITEFKDFCVAVTHLDTTREGPSADVQASNAVAIATIRDTFVKYTKPVFLCGDWNTRPEWENMARFNEFLDVISPTNGVRTYHGQKASGGSVIDYISVDQGHKDDFYVANAFVVEDIVTSDHNPVIAELYRKPSASELSWVDERAITSGLTGTWSKPIVYDRQAMKAELSGENVFTPSTPSDGERVTMTVTAAFDAIPFGYDAPGNAAQGAIWLGTNGCFQVWAKAGNGEQGTGNGWIDVEAEGVTPTTCVDYTFRFVFDYATRKYSVSVLDGGAYKPLAAKGVSSFQLTTSASAVSGVRFTGDGVLTSLTGEYVAVEGFSEAETVLLKDNAEVILDAAKAAWLNSCAGGKTAVGSAAAGLSAQEFSDAYLLNLDITDGDRSYAFEITGVDVGAETVTVGVKLTRNGHIAQSINGTLKFYGAATLDAFKNPALQPLSSATVSDSDFSEGDTATAAFPKVDGSAVNTFFKAKIEER